MEKKLIPVSRTFLAAAALAVLCSCGGGGGGETTQAAATVSFSVPRLDVGAFQNQQANVTAFQDATVSVDAAASGNLTGTVYAVVQDTGTGFAGSAIQVMQTQAGFRATLKPNVSLAPGSYTGNLQLHLCKDAACAQEYTVAGATLPYTVTIAPQLQATLLVNGAAAGTIRSGRGSLPLSLADGSTLEVQSNVPMQMMYSSGPGFVTVTVDPSSTSTDWKAVLARPAFPTTNEIVLSVVPQDSTKTIQMSGNLDVTMVP